MSKELKAKLIKYGCAALFVVVMGYIYLDLWGFMEADLSVKLRLLCDAFMIPGILLICFGGLVWASNEGAMDGLGYALSIFARSLIPGARSKKDERYADYVERKRNNRTKGYGFLFIVGLISTAIGLVFFVLFYTV